MKSVSFLVIILFLLTIFVNKASACTCGETTVSENLHNAKAVFLGKVVSKKKSDLVEKDGVEVFLEVQRVWKGNIFKTTIVYTGATDDLYPFLDLCATPFRIGERYIVFAYGKDRLTTDVCAGTGAFPYANEVIKKLGKGRLPAKAKTQKTKK